ncbi:MAG: carbonic anhydrase [Coraliomargaritaceae bacterium]
MSPEELLKNNQTWASTVEASSPGSFLRSAEGQSPNFLWIGCSDSRVPPCRITGSEPGQIFVHRNIANLVVENDDNLQAILRYSIEALKVPNVILCGHTRCGGVQAALHGCPFEEVNRWVRPINQLAQVHADELNALKEAERVDRLCELNVLAQTERLAENPILQAAWKNGQRLQIHSWIYRLESGQLDVLREPLDNPST